MQGRFAVLLSTALGLALVLGGCGGDDPDKPPLGQVRGKVTYNGKPVTNGSVIFTPVVGKGGTTGQVAIGQLQLDGSYALTTFEDGDGAILGEHTVTVEARESNMADLNRPGQVAKGPSSRISYVEPKSTVPKKYLSPTTSPLRFTVAAGKNQYDLPLTD